MERNISKTFKEAVELTPDIAAGYRNGLGALGKNSAKIIVPDSRLLGGSVDIDNCTKNIYPDSSRWDYAIDYNKEVFFIEVHPAQTCEIRTMINKLRWLQVWLKENAVEIDKLKTGKVSPFFWLQTNGCAIPKSSPQYRAAIAAGLIPMAKWDYQLIMRKNKL